MIITQDADGITHSGEKYTISERNLTVDNLFTLLEEHPHLHWLKAYYEQLTEMFGKAQADKEIVDIGNPDLHIDVNYVRFVVMARRSKKPIEKRIANIYRMRGPDSKEYIKWSGQLRGENKLGEPIETSISNVGYGQKPQYKQTFNRRELEWRPSLEIAKTKPVYTIEWNPENIEELSKYYYDDDGMSHTRFVFIDYQNRKQACPKEILPEEWRQWWETLPRVEFLARMAELSKRPLPPKVS
jgi:hypothetical protein